MGEARGASKYPRGVGQPGDQEERGGSAVSDALCLHLLPESLFQLHSELDVEQDCCPCREDQLAPRFA